MANENNNNQDRIDFSKGSTVFGRLPKATRKRPPATSARGTDNKLTNAETAGKYAPEQNTVPQVKVADNGGHFEFTAAPIGDPGFTEKVYQDSLNEVAVKYRELRGLGRQPVVNVTGLATNSLKHGKGSVAYAKQRADAIAKELLKRGIPQSALNLDNDPGKEDPRSLSSAQKALKRGAIIDVRRQDNTGFYDERTFGSKPNIESLKTYGDLILDQFTSIELQNQLAPSDMIPGLGRIGRMTIKLADLIDSRFYNEHSLKLQKAGLPKTKSNGKPHDNAFNGSIRNAFRHTIWQGLGTYYLGIITTKSVADYKDPINIPPLVKENQSFRGPDGTATLARADTVIDLLNNRIGRKIGGENHAVGGESVVLKILHEAYENGLWVAESIENLGTAQNPDFEVTIKKHQITLGQYTELREKIKQLFKDPENARVFQSLEDDLDNPIGGGNR